MEAINDIVFPYLLVKILEGVIVFFIGSLLILFLALGIHKESVKQTDKRRKRKVRYYVVELQTISAKEPTIKAPRNLFDAECLAEAFSEFSKDASSKSILDARVIIKETKTIKFLKKGLESEDWGKRHRSLSAFSRLGFVDEFDYLIEYTENEENYKNYTNGLIACACSIGAPGDLIDLSGLIAERPSVSGSYDEGIYIMAMKSLEQSCGYQCLVRTIKARLRNRRVRINEKISIINAVGKRGLIELKDVMIEEAKKVRNNSLLTSVLRALNNLKICDQFSTNFIGSEVLSVNLSAIRASATCKSPVAARKIAHELGNPNYFVRQAAALALLRMGPTFRSILKKAIVSDDKFVRDMALYALSRG